MFFDEVRKVQIGRRSTAPSREEILAIQRREKERRELEKRRSDSATCIQKIWRGFWTRRETSKALVGVADKAGQARRFVIYSLVQRIFFSALGRRLDEVDLSSIEDQKLLMSLLGTRARARLEFPHSHRFRPDQLPVVMDFLRSSRISWAKVPREDIENYIRHTADVGVDILAQVPDVCKSLSDACLAALVTTVAAFTLPVDAVFEKNLKDLAEFAIRKRMHAIDQFIWKNEIIFDECNLELSREFPGLALSLWPALATQTRTLVGVLSMIAVYETKLSELFGGSVRDVANALTLEIGRNRFRHRLYEMFAGLLALNLRILYKRELLDRKSAQVRVDRLRFWGLVANQVAANSLFVNLPVPDTTFALARVSYDRRSTLGVADNEWYVTGNFQDPNPRELAEFLTENSELKNVLGNFLKRLPHAIPFERRVRLFHALMDEDTYRGGFVRRSATVRRAELFHDGLKIFTTHQGIKDNLRIAFINEVGQEEAGVDGGGLLKEFLHLWMQSAVDSDRGLFVEQKNRKVIPRALVSQPESYAAVGRAVGKALYERVLAETRFSEIFMNRVFGRPFSVDELEELDDELYRSLFRLKESLNVHTWGVTFVASGTGGTEVQLIPNGADELVTDANKLQYIHLLARHKLVTEISRAASDFATGLESIVPLAYMRFFSSTELEMLISGEEREGFDVEDLKKNCVYSGAYSANSQTVQLFWHLVQNDMTIQDRVALLTFVTSSPRAPLLGFGVLSPKFAIQGVPDPDRLPTASTCVNLLKLPDYRDYEILKHKLLLAIHAKSGFDFS